MRLLDLFCGAGGCSVGYHRAGFTEIVGVDVDRAALRRYPYTAVRMDAMTALAGGIDLDGFDAVHASPPCQAYSIATRNSATADHAAHVAATGHMLPDTIAALTEWGERTGRPWVVENVPGSDAAIYAAPWVITLCGAQRRIVSESGVPLRLRRHRLFASNVPLMAEPCSCGTPGVVSVSGHGPSSSQRSLVASVVRHGGSHNTVSVAKGGVPFTANDARALMGTEWMTRDQTAQAIPPAYTEHVGWQLLAHLAETAA